jgi:hypothetical protein
MLLVSCALVGCLPDGPREVAFPTFDPRAPFPELSGSDDAPPPAGDGDETAGFEEALAELAEETGDSAEEEGDPNVQTVALAGRFKADVPAGPEWSWATDGKVTMLAWRKDGAGDAAALVYAEAFSPRIKASPSSELQRFYRTVDPALTTPLSMSGLGEAVMRNVAQSTNVDMGTMTRLMRQATTRTMGMGLNYESADGTFTGWQWVGHNPAEVELRLGRTSGTWSSGAEIDTQVLDALETFSGQAPQLAGLNDQLGGFGGLGGSGGQGATSRSSAWMLVGSASTSTSSGVHLAIMCKTPNCPVSQELAELLETLEGASSAELDALRRGATVGSIPEMASQLGIPFLPEDQVVQPDQLMQQLQQLQNLGGGALPGLPGGASPGGASPLEGLPLEGLPIDPTNPSQPIDPNKLRDITDQLNNL